MQMSLFQFSSSMLIQEKQSFSYCIHIKIVRLKIAELGIIHFSLKICRVSPKGCKHSTEKKEKAKLVPTQDHWILKLGPLPMPPEKRY